MKAELLPFTRELFYNTRLKSPKHNDQNAVLVPFSSTRRMDSDLEKQENETAGDTVNITFAGSEYPDDGEIRTVPPVTVTVPRKWITDVLEDFINFPVMIDNRSGDSRHSMIAACIERLPEAQQKLIEKLRTRKRTAASLSENAVYEVAEHIESQMGSEPEHRKKWDDAYDADVKDSRGCGLFDTGARLHLKKMFAERKKIALKRAKNLKKNDFENFFAICAQLDTHFFSSLFHPTGASFATPGQKAKLFIFVTLIELEGEE